MVDFNEVRKMIKYSVQEPLNEDRWAAWGIYVVGKPKSIQPPPESFKVPNRLAIFEELSSPKHKPLDGEWVVFLRVVRVVAACMEPCSAVVTVFCGKPPCPSMAPSFR